MVEPVLYYVVCCVDGPVVVLGCCGVVVFLGDGWDRLVEVLGWVFLQA